MDTLRKENVELGAQLQTFQEKEHRKNQRQFQTRQHHLTTIHAYQRNIEELNQVIAQQKLHIDELQFMRKSSLLKDRKAFEQPRLLQEKNYLLNNQDLSLQATDLEVVAFEIKCRLIAHKIPYVKIPSVF